MKCSVAYGVSSDGLMTTVFPAASAGITFMPIDTSGPFQVRMIPITPYGSGIEYASSRWLAGNDVTRPSTLSAHPA